MGNRFITGWARFWFSPADPTLLGVLRICCGVVVLAVQIVNSVHLQSFLGEHAWIDLQTANALRREAVHVVPDPSWEEDTLVPLSEQVVKGNTVWSLWFHVTDPEAMALIQAGILVVAVLFTLGFWTRVTTALTWLAYLSCLHRMDKMMYGMDVLIGIVLLSLMLGPSGAALSLDRLLARYWLGRKAPPPSAGANFSLRLMQIQLCIVYLSAGLSKLQSPVWWNGTALSEPLLNYEISLLRYPWYAEAYRSILENRWMGEFVLTVAVFYTLVVEIVFPFLVWQCGLRYPMVVAAFLLHLGIGVLMVSLHLFSLIMMTLVLSFVPPEDARAGVSRLFRAIREFADRLRRASSRLVRDEPPPTLVADPPVQAAAQRPADAAC
jgi:hypothetical protein